MLVKNKIYTHRVPTPSHPIFFPTYSTHICLIKNSILMHPSRQKFRHSFCAHFDLFVLPLHFCAPGSRIFRAHASRVLLHESDGIFEHDHVGDPPRKSWTKTHEILSNDPVNEKRQGIVITKKWKMGKKAVWCGEVCNWDMFKVSILLKLHGKTVPLTQEEIVTKKGGHI